YGGLLGGFFLAIFWSRARQRDAILGMSIGITVMSVVVFAKQLIAAFPGLAHALGPVSTIAFLCPPNSLHRHDFHRSGNRRRWLEDARHGRRRTGARHRRNRRTAERRAAGPRRGVGRRDRRRAARCARVLRDDARHAAGALRRRRRRRTGRRATGALALVGGA